MKLLHLSDLHLGKRMDEASMLEDQAYILRQIVGIVREEKADAVLICGDIYDKSVPSAEAVALFDDFLSRLSRVPVPVFAISGNHDSPERIAFGSRLMADAGVHMSPVYDGSVAPLTLSDSHGTVQLWLLPFLKPAHVKRHFPEEHIESYTDAIRVAISQMGVDFGQRNVLLTHQFVTGASLCDSEEISVGGSDNVDAAVFEGFDYVALGHIHGPQNIGSNRIRYCGTPLKYSFSEAEHYKSVTLVELEEKGNLHLRMIPLTPLRDLRKIRGSFRQILDSNPPSEDYLEVTLTDEEDIPEAIGKLRIPFPNLLHLRYDNTRTRTQQAVDGPEAVAEKQPLELFEELYEKINNQSMTREQKAFAAGLIQEIWEDKP